MIFSKLLKMNRDGIPLDTMTIRAWISAFFIVDYSVFRCGCHNTF